MTLKKFENFQLFESTYLNNITSSIHTYNSFINKMNNYFNNQIIKVQVVYGDSLKFKMLDDSETIMTFEEVENILYK